MYPATGTGNLCDAQKYPDYLRAKMYVISGQKSKIYFGLTHLLSQDI
jgi:hypothetical protein